VSEGERVVVEEQVLSRVIASVETELNEQPLPAPGEGAPTMDAHELLRPFMRYAPPAQRSVNESAKPEKGGSVSRLENINKILQKLQSDSDGVEASALISEDGLMVASALPPSMEETRVAGMTATLLNLGSRGAVELARGRVQEIIVRGDRGYAVLISADRGALLLALTSESSKLGLVFFDMREAVTAIQKVL
jgi:predicted regulator of Ras-like GTPase activity (Roadblock/LC7/MglB family)